jgi:hypothetical protein
MKETKEVKRKENRRKGMLETDKHSNEGRGERKQRKEARKKAINKRHKEINKMGRT